MTESSAGGWLRRCIRALVVATAIGTAASAAANGSDLPQEVVLQGYVNVDDARAHLLVRVPLALLASFPLPKRGPGYLDLTNIEPRLRQAAAAISRQLELSTGGATLQPATSEVQLSLLSDRSFASYANALAHLQAPPLPASTDLFWSQGYLDIHYEYPLASPSSNLWIRLNVPELGQRIKLRLQYIGAGAAARSYEIAGSPSWIPLDPRWYDAAWFFARVGFVDTFSVDRFVFLLCLIAPFRRFRGLGGLVVLIAALQALTLTGAAEGALADVDAGWLPAFADTVLAAALLVAAVANLATPTLRRRILVAAVVASVGGFGLGRLLMSAAPFAGAHPLIASVGFNVGAALGTFAGVAIGFVALRVLFAIVLGPLVGVIVVSLLAGHAGWHGLIDSGRELGRQLLSMPPASVWSAVSSIALWLVPALLSGVAGFLLPRRFDGITVPTLRRALEAAIAAKPPVRAPVAETREVETIREPR